MYLLVKMVVFHYYVSLPEGIYIHEDLCLVVKRQPPRGEKRIPKAPASLVTSKTKVHSSALDLGPPKGSWANPQNFREI